LLVFRLIEAEHDPSSLWKREPAHNERVAIDGVKGEHSAQLIDHLKKTEMAKEAERLLDGTRWLPEPLRLAGPERSVTEPAREAEALPDFLIGDEDAAADPEEAEPHVIAAE
jgi:ParB family chromosome partitioning protein